MSSERLPNGDRRVALELVLAANGVVVGWVTATISDPGPAWAYAVVAATAFTAAAVSDRHPLGYLVLASLGVALGAGILWSVSGGPRWFVPVSVAGLGFGVGCNRLVFGVLRPLPAVRRQRLGR